MNFYLIKRYNVEVLSLLKLSLMNEQEKETLKELAIPIAIGFIGLVVAVCCGLYLLFS